MAATEPADSSPQTPDSARITIADRLQAASGVVAVFVVLAGAGVLAGWIFRIPALTTVFPRFAAMKPNTALALLLSGAALWLYQFPGLARWRTVLLTTCAAAAALIGTATCFEILADVNLHIDDLLFRSTDAVVTGSTRMALSTAASLLLVNAALLLSDRTDRLAVPHLMVGLSAVLSGLSLVGAIFSQSMLTGAALVPATAVADYTNMATHTSLAILLLCAGFVLAHPSSSVMTIVADEGPAGFVVRRLLPPVFLLPVLLGWIWWQGVARSYYDVAYAMTLFVSSAIGALGLVVWLAGHLVRGLEHQRVQAEAGRRQSEERLRRAVSDAPVPIIIHDESDQILHMSQGWQDLSGYSMRDVTTVSQWITLAQQATRAQAQAYVQRLRGATETVHGTETPIVTRQGHTRYWEFTTTPLGRLGDGQPTYLTMALDITERRESEAQLRLLNEELEARIDERTGELTRANESLQRQSEQLREQAALLDLASDGIIVRDLAGTVVYWSAGAAAMFGYRRDEALGQDCHDLLRSEFPGARDAIDAQVLTEGHWEGEVVVTRQDGSRITVESRWTLTRTARGEPQGFLEITRDVTARKMAAESLRESELRFRAVAETATVGVVMADEAGLIRYWNPGAEAMFGWLEDDALGRPLTLIMPDRMRAAHEAGLRRYLETREPRILGRTLEMAGLRSDGTEFPIEISISSWRTSKGVFFSAFLRDITLRRDAEQVLRAQAEELARSNQELEQFAYVASHDLQEPLRMVSNYTQLLASRYRERLDGDALEFIDFAVDGAKRMQMLIHDLLQYARVGTRGKEFRETSTEQIVRDTVQNLAGVVEETGARIRVGPLPTVRGDQSQLAQVFQNLIGNALKFRRSDAPPVVDVSAEEEDGAWVFRVADNGIGIDQKYFDRIFQMFQRLHGREQYEGTGIGLALCKKIVERHGGRITVSSEPGRGTTFAFTIPAAPTPAARVS
ncbi:MAG: PAS domain S-box protein [Vicinamibacterales bacterium]